MDPPVEGLPEDEERDGEEGWARLRFLERSLSRSNFETENMGSDASEDVPRTSFVPLWMSTYERWTMSGAFP